MSGGWVVGDRGICDGMPDRCEELGRKGAQKKGAATTEGGTKKTAEKGRNGKNLAVKRSVPI